MFIMLIETAIIIKIPNKDSYKSKTSDYKMSKSIYRKCYI